MVEDGKFTWVAPFWDQPMWRWDAMTGIGVRSAFVASRHGARLMLPNKRCLLVNISIWAARKHIGGVFDLSFNGWREVRAKNLPGAQPNVFPSNAAPSANNSTSAGFSQG